MADQYIRRLQTGILKQQVQFFRYLLAGARRWSWLAPAISCTVVRAHPGELLYARLYQIPSHRGYSQAAVEDDSRCARASTVHVQPESTDFY